MTRRILALLEITRPHNMLAAALFAAVGFHVAGGHGATPLVLVALLTALVTGAGNVVNDLFDESVDRINKPRRPLPSERVTRVHARIEYVVLTVAIGAVSVLAWRGLGDLPGEVIALLAAWHVLLFAYAACLKRVLLVGNLLVAAVGASAFLAGALTAGDAAQSVTPIAIAFAFVFSREVIKGGEDIEGDRLLGVSTLASRFGRSTAARIAAVSMLVLAAVIPVPAVVGTYGNGYTWLMELVVVPLLVIGAVMVTRHPEKATFGRVSRLLKLGMFAGIAAIAIG